MKYDSIAALLTYPTETLAAEARAAAAEIADLDETAGALVARFAEWARTVMLHDAEELFTRTFDLAAPCAMDVGWQLFGESYKRGQFLVKARMANRAHGIVPGSELDDHLPVLLRLLPRLEPDEDPRELAVEAMLPAIDKMIEVLDEENPYRALLDATRKLLARSYHVTLGPVRPRTVHLPVASLEVEP